MGVGREQDGGGMTVGGSRLFFHDFQIWPSRPHATLTIGKSGLTEKDKYCVLILVLYFFQNMVERALEK